MFGIEITNSLNNHERPYAPVGHKTLRDAVAPNENTIFPTISTNSWAKW